MSGSTNKLAMCALAVCLLCTTAAEVSASGRKTEERYSPSFLSGGDTVSVVQQTTEVSSQEGTVTATFRALVPDAESPEQNAGSTAQLQKGRHFASPPGNGGAVTFGEPGCILYTTTLVYNVQTEEDGTRLYDILSFRLDREIYTMAPYNSVHNATVRVDQAGFSDDAGDPGLLESQSVSLGEIEFGRTYSKGNDWPGDWLAVSTSSDLPEIGITYEVLLDYADGTSRTLSFTHSAH